MKLEKPSQDRAIELFVSRFGKEPQVISSAPGRVNLAGEHTDYQEGFVLPAAINLRTAVAASVSETDSTEIISELFGNPVVFDSSTLSVQAHVEGWGAYVAGVLWVLREQGIDIPQVQLAVASDIPLGAGLSSSAALEVAVALAVLKLVSADLMIEKQRVELAVLCRRAENEYVGVPCGILDQAASLLAQTGKAVWIDCRTLQFRHVPMNERIAIVVADSGIRHELASSEYAKRRKEVEEASQLLGVRTLRDAEPEMLEKLRLKSTQAGHDADYTNTLIRRARHVITENKRVGQIESALIVGDLDRLRSLYLASHCSLRDDYEVSCQEIDDIVEWALKHDACIGARLSGGGFGGSVLCLVEREKAADFCEYLWQRLPWIKAVRTFEASESSWVRWVKA